jgi:hypothetical protein
MEDSTPQGDQGFPIQQRESAQGSGGLAPEREQLTYDTNLHTVFDSQPLVNQGRLKVEDAYAPEIVVQGFMAAVNQEVRANITGITTLTVQTLGTWAGTLSFFASVDGQTWNAITGQTLTATSFASTTTTQGMWRFSTAGVTNFKVQFTSYTSGLARVVLVGSGTCLVPNVTAITSTAATATVTIDGSSANPILQNVVDSTNGRLIVMDNGYIKDALQYPDPFDPNRPYFAGDTMLWNNGQVYQCILYLAAGVAYSTSFPNNIPSGTYWILDRRQYKSAIARNDTVAPVESRMKVQLEFAQYNRQLVEQQALVQSKGYIDDVIREDMMLSVMENQGGAGSKQFYLGQDSMSHYLFEEVR